MQDSIRVRENRQDNSQKLSETFMGVMVKATAYNCDVRTVDLYQAIPTDARSAGQMADGLLPRGC